MALNHMRLRLLLLMLLVVGGPQAVLGQDAPAPARQSADSWLALIDRQQYVESWQAAGTFFKNAVTAEKWQEAARIARGPLGALKSRSLKSATPSKTLPGAPDGEYVVFQFNTTFERKAAAVETVTTVREPDSTWRVVGYFVK
jgi:uncharacterized protein DUF4019